MAEMVCGRNILWPNRSVVETSRKRCRRADYNILFNVVMKPGSVLLPRINKFTFSDFFILSSPLGLLFSLMAFLVWLLSYTAKKAMTTVF